MRWYEYKMEVDDLHAPEDLKARLMAMQAGAPQSAAPAHKPRKAAPRAVRFPLRRVLEMAACFVVGVVCVSALVSRSGAALIAGGAEEASSSAAVGAVYAARSGQPTAVSYQLDTANGLTDGGTALTEGEAAAARDVSEADSAKIIYRADLSLESKDYEAARAALDEALTEAGGYLESSSEAAGSEDGRRLSMTLRVPQENYTSFLDTAAAAGKLLNRSEQAEDVTASYMDVEARLENLKAQRARLQQMQAQAETLSDLLQIESSLSDVQYQIESWQSQLDWYARQVACCTVTISLHEVQEYTAAPEGFGERIAHAFGQGWSAFADGLQSLAVWLVFAWPVVLLAAAVVGFVLLLRRKR